MSVPRAASAGLFCVEDAAGSGSDYHACCESAPLLTIPSHRRPLCSEKEEKEEAGGAW
jgi:hypothetical protein